MESLKSGRWNEDDRNNKEKNEGNKEVTGKVGQEE